MLDPLTQHAGGAVAVEEEHGRVRAERSAYVRVDVDWSGRGGIRGGGGGGDEERCSVGGIVRIGESEPGAECLVVGRVDAQIVCFEG